jgi:hypothetical protein
MTSRKPIVHAAINHESHPPTLDWPIAGRYDKQATSTRQLRGIAVPSRGAARPSCECRHATRKLEGAGNAGCTMHPQPCVQRVKAHKRSYHRYAETFRHSPRDGFTVSFVISPVTGLCCHRRLADLSSTDLIPASGDQDHTTSPSASQGARLAHSKRPSHPALHVRDDAQRPS